MISLPMAQGVVPTVEAGRSTTLRHLNVASGRPRSPASFDLCRYRLGPFALGQRNANANAIVAVRPEKAIIGAAE